MWAGDEMGTPLLTVFLKFNVVCFWLEQFCLPSRWEQAEATASTGSCSSLCAVCSSKPEGLPQSVFPALLKLGRAIDFSRQTENKAGLKAQIQAGGFGSIPLNPVFNVQSPAKKNKSL